MKPVQGPKDLVLPDITAFTRPVFRVLDEVTDRQPDAARRALFLSGSSQICFRWAAKRPFSLCGTLKGRAFRMARAVDFRHIGKADSRGVPRLPKGSIGDQARNRSTAGYVQSIIKADLDQILTKPTEKPGRVGTTRDDPVSGFSLLKGFIWGFQEGTKNVLSELTAHRTQS